MSEAALARQLWQLMRARRDDTLAGVVATQEDLNRANALLGHPRGCRCSTCLLAARLGHAVRSQQ